MKTLFALWGWLIIICTPVLGGTSGYGRLPFVEIFPDFEVAVCAVPGEAFTHRLFVYPTSGTATYTAGVYVDGTDTSLGTLAAGRGVRSIDITATDGLRVYYVVTFGVAKRGWVELTAAGSSPAGEVAVDFDAVSGDMLAAFMAGFGLAATVRIFKAGLRWVKRIPGGDLPRA